MRRNPRIHFRLTRRGLSPADCQNPSVGRGISPSGTGSLVAIRIETVLEKDLWAVLIALM
jgi:hypothetical protein